ncbi:MAG: hypothetical protein ACR2GO_06650, partial [Candidatus Limnocylindria bacterium]
MSRSDRIMIAAGGGALILALAAAWLALAPVEEAAPELVGGLALPTPVVNAPVSSAEATAVATGPIV